MMKKAHYLQDWPGAGMIECGICGAYHSDLALDFKHYDFCTMPEIVELRGDLATARERIAELEAALRPFAEAGQHALDNLDGKLSPMFRAAVAAMAKAPEGEDSA